MTGRYLDHFTVGDVYKHWPGRTVNAGDSTWFGLLSMNRQTTDDPVIETFVFSVVVGLSVADTSARAIANLGFEKVVFQAPVHVGDTIYAESEVLEIRESQSKPDRGTVYIETRGFNQRAEPILTLRRRFLLSRGPAATLTPPNTNPPA